MSRGRPIERRAFLRGVLLGTTAVAAGGALAACAPGRLVTSARPAIPTRRDPVTWPIDGDLVVPDGLGVERGATLRVYQWREYLSSDVLDAFARRHAADDISVEVESFSDMDEALVRLREPGADFDVLFPTVDVLGRLIDARLLRPMNGSYLPNVANLWPEFRGADGPFYDVGARYTVPYTVYSSGVAWRTDLVAAEDAAAPFGLPWHPRYAGRTGFLDQYREALALALVRDGVTDVNTGDASALARAGAAIGEAVEAGARITQDGTYEALPDARVVAHQAWSGDVLTALTYEGRDPVETGRTLAYWWPMDGTGWVGCDLTAICARGRNPVLAHAFVDHLLDERIAFANFRWNGYQPPLEAITRERALAGYPGLAAMDHHCTILSPEDFAAGQLLHELDPRTDARWLDAWQDAVAAA
jgi:spermidine/putrescine transport system substrate-binding protein